MKQTIICIVGESGTGKTYIASILEADFGIPMIESRTTRPRRDPAEGGHMWVTEEEFDTYEQEEMIAFCTFGTARYCCLLSDVDKRVMSYVINESGLEYLRENFSSRYNIFACRVQAEEELRKNHVSRERMDRDKGQFTLSEEHFDYFIKNRYKDEDTYRQTMKLVLRASQQFN